MNALMTNAERRMAAEALQQMLAGEGDYTAAQWAAADSALTKLTQRDPARTLRDCLNTAFKAFAHDDDGPVWAASLIAKTRRVLKATESDK
jgi:hypothetical protein